MPETPRVRAHFLVCTNRRPDDHPLPCCGARGGAGVLEAFLRELGRRGYPSGVKVTATGCLTPCQYGPTVLVYPEGVWYAGVTPGDVSEILEAHANGGSIERLRLPTEVRVL